MEQQYFELQPSEAAILAAASRIYAAGVIAGGGNAGPEQPRLDEAVAQAVYLARRVERAVRSDDETSA